jgi:hypothetical protein
MQDDAGQEEGVIDDSGGLVLLRHQPTHFKDVLVQPPFKLAEQVNQTRDNQPGS